MASAPHGERCDVKEGIKNYYNQLEGKGLKLCDLKSIGHMCVWNTVKCVGI